MPLRFDRPRRDLPSGMGDAEAREFCEGWCHLFAAALNRLTGWPVVALRDPDPASGAEAHTWVHFLVEAPDGMLWDALGGASRATVLAHYPWIARPGFDSLGGEAAIRGLPCFGRGLRAYGDAFLAGAEDDARAHVMPLIARRYPTLAGTAAGMR